MKIQRIAIVGNGGSGKSYLAQSISANWGLPTIHLDLLFWDEGWTQKNPHGKKRSKDALHGLIESESQKDAWVVEGIYGELIERVLPRIQLLVWLDLDRAICLDSIRQRFLQSGNQNPEGWESHQQLLQYVQQYWERTDLRSHTGHQTLFEQFSRRKLRLTERDSVIEQVREVLERG